MRTIIIQIIIIALLGYLFELFLPWWSIAIAAALGGTFLRSKANFIAGFLGIGVLWFAAAVLIDFTSPSELADKVAPVFMVNNTVLIIITSLLGALVGGFASLSGSYLLPKRK